MYRVTTRTRKRSVLCVITLRLSLGSCLRGCELRAQIGHGLGTKSRERNDRLSPFRFANWLPPFMFALRASHEVGSYGQT